MHIIESGDLAKPVATLSPVTKLSGNDAYYSTYYCAFIWHILRSSLSPRHFFHAAAAAAALM